MSKRAIKLGELFIAKKHIVTAEVEENLIKLTMSNNEKFWISPKTSILSYSEDEGYTPVAMEPSDFNEVSYEVSGYFL